MRDDADAEWSEATQSQARIVVEGNRWFCREFGTALEKSRRVLAIVLESVSLI